MGIYIPAATTANLAEVVKAYRDNAVALRKRLKSRPTRNFASTQKAIARRAQDGVDTLRELELLGQIELAGYLHEEQNLLGRVIEAKAEGKKLPQVQTQLDEERRRIQDILAVVIAVVEEPTPEPVVEAPAPAPVHEHRCNHAGCAKKATKRVVVELSGDEVEIELCGRHARISVEQGFVNAVVLAVRALPARRAHR